MYDLVHVSRDVVRCAADSAPLYRRGAHQPRRAALTLLPHPLHPAQAIEWFRDRRARDPLPSRSGARRGEVVPLPSEGGTRAYEVRGRGTTPKPRRGRDGGAWREE